LQGYAGNDGVKQQFTGYERDSESGLDYAQARYFSSKHGRFTSVDPLTASASMKNPQTFNRYSYAMNSPYKFVDPLGLKSVPNRGCQGGQNCMGSGQGYDDAEQGANAESNLSQSERNSALAKYIFERASQGYITDMGSVTGSMIGYTSIGINNDVSANFSVSSGTLTMTNVVTTTETRFRSDGTQIGKPKVTTRTDTLTRAGTSGTGDCMNNPECAKDSAEYKSVGPTPIGSYTINTKKVEIIDTPKTIAKVGKIIGTAIRSATGVHVSPDWGSFRVPLNPNYSELNRDGHYLHGGSFPGTIGCVDIGGGEFGDSGTRSVLRMLRIDSDYSVPFTVSN
jgi:RHS repeat-associated protein